MVDSTTGAASGIAAGGGTTEDRDGDKTGALLLSGMKRARLMPTRSYDKVTPEAGTIYYVYCGALLLCIGIALQEMRGTSSA